jgi:hypothetical protein
MPYKATYNYKCLDQIYEIGQEYKTNETPILCERGFHFCNIAKNVLEYYPIEPSFKLLEIEDLNPNDTVNKGNKSCSNHIKIIREIVDSNELFELLGQAKTFDENGRELTFKGSSGYWHERTYDLNGRELTFKDSNGYSHERTCDLNGRELTFRNSNGHWYERTYDLNGKELTYKESGGFWRERTYDSDGQELSYKDSMGYWCERTYDPDGKELSYKDLT